ncbi:unnamed protein product [Strongylus vulgaris]|uniref:Uncharacterized protein n=1 Tax=Strongylus vulgaris TaxID=40348 RepID=A0A3P7I3Z0_STRVU|nr:unnamed protein product [Strongylus vulgaris]
MGEENAQTTIPPSVTTSLSTPSQSVVSESDTEGVETTPGQIESIVTTIIDQTTAAIEEATVAGQCIRELVTKQVTTGFTKREN